MNTINASSNFHSESQVELMEQNLQVGETIRIVRGPLKGLEGEISQVQVGKLLIAVRFDGLGYACVSIDTSDIEIYGQHRKPC